MKIHVKFVVDVTPKMFESLVRRADLEGFNYDIEGKEGTKRIPSASLKVHRMLEFYATKVVRSLKDE